MSDGRTRHRILFVCTANICRSPAAEALARHRFGESAALFRSAGFLDDGHPCPRDLVHVLDERGVDVSAHRSYHLDQASLEAADLVLTMEGEHVQRATLLHRPSFAKILPLKEAAARLTGAPPTRLELEEFVESVNSSRDPSSYLSTRWDVADPYRRRLRHYRQAVDEIEGLIDVVCRRLIGPPTSAAG